MPASAHEMRLMWILAMGRRAAIGKRHIRRPENPPRKAQLGSDPLKSRFWV